MKSPCQKRCVFSLETDSCTTCGRSVNQIMNWRAYTDIEREQIMSNLAIKGVQSTPPVLD